LNGYDVETQQHVDIDREVGDYNWISQTKGSRNDSWLPINKLQNGFLD